MPVEISGSDIFGVHHDSRHCQRCTGVRYLLTGIGQKNRAQAFPLKVGGDGKSSDKRHRHRISG